MTDTTTPAGADDPRVRGAQRVMARIPDLAVTCYCGHTADAEEFWRSPMGLPLPEGVFQCPNCGRAWRKRYTGQIRDVVSLVGGRFVTIHEGSVLESVERTL